MVAYKLMELEPVIGLEIHLQPITASKMFCACRNILGDERVGDLNAQVGHNTQTCPICRGEPGTLPSLNQEAVNKALKLAVALGAQVNQRSVFDRKNYSYPDLPKGYQITQFHHPLAQHGRLVYEHEGQTQALRMTELHLEEDTGRLFHPVYPSTQLEGAVHIDQKITQVDYNRAGAPLVEMVFAPDLHSGAAAKAAVTELRLLVRSLGVSDADMEKGHLRCDANVSMRPLGSQEMFTKVEIKNLNSLRGLQRALDYEIKRQTQLWEKDQAPSDSETRGWDERQQITVAQRTKEGRHDYRYFPEPDLPPLVISDDWLAKVKQDLPVLPAERRRHLVEEYKLSSATTALLVERGFDDYFSEVISEGHEWLTSTLQEGSSEEEWAKHGQKFIKQAVNWLDELAKHLQTIPQAFKPTPENFAEFLTFVIERRVNSSAAQVLLKRMVERGGDPSQILATEDLAQVSDSESLAEIIEQVISGHPDAVKEIQAGKIRTLKFLIGAAMKISKGKADPEAVKNLLMEKLGINE